MPIRDLVTNVENLAVKARPVPQACGRCDLCEIECAFQGQAELPDLLDHHSQKMKAIALISGGKDSLFSILHCLENGHEIVALANLYPAPIQQTSTSPHNTSTTTHDITEQHHPDDTDSYMYQTIGHNLIPLYAEALNLPLYRQPIHGSAVITTKTYSPDASQHPDETESLIPLLRRVMAVHPSANAISTGAILSSYQRTRIESVALRLGLTPLAYLWQWPFLPPHTHASLLEDMMAVGQDARIIKVASGGLGEGDLWRSVAEPATVARLARQMGRFGGLEAGTVLGEGGEYETICLDGPANLWKRRIVIEDRVREIVRGEGGASAVKVHEAKMVRKEEQRAAAPRVRVPKLLDEEFGKVLDALKNGPTSISPCDATRPVSSIATTTTTSETPYATHLCNISATSSSSPTPITDQATAIIATITAFLNKHNLPSSAITFTSILLRHMADFAIINTIYGALFPLPNPPARITVACGDALPQGTDVLISIIISKLPPATHRALHVQSRSYWAPANIGPYSQAVAVRLPQKQRRQDGDEELCYVAGQIPLRPADMEIVGGGFEAQAVLALQHLWRIGREMGVCWWTGAVAFVVGEGAGEVRRRVFVAGEAWRLVHESGGYEQEDDADEREEEEFDIADRQLRGAWSSHHSEGMRVTRRTIPDVSIAREVAAGGEEERLTPPMFVLEMAELPRGAAVEWWSHGICGHDVSVSVSTDPSRHAERWTVEGVEWSVEWMEIKTEAELAAVGGWLGTADGKTVELFTSRQAAAEAVRGSRAMVLPCRSVWNAAGEELVGVLRITG